MQRGLILFTVAALAACAAPAGAQVYPERIRSVARARVEAAKVEHYQRREREEQTERFTKTVRLGANGQIDISNIAGDITVTRGGGSDATIEVTKVSRGRTVDDAREMLPLVSVEITERAGRVEVRTHYPDDDRRTNNRRNINVSVSYSISAPAGASITAESISGNVSVRDLRGELSLSSISGNIAVANGGRISNAKSISGNVEITATEIESASNVSSVSGNVTVRNLKARRLDLGSVSGNIIIDDVACDRVQAQTTSGDVDFRGALAGGGRYDLQSHSGEVRITLAGDTGFELDANSFSGSVRTDLPITIQGTRGRDRRVQRGTYGDGSAILHLTTFSGNIVIMKR
jgi:DUF4097 and DUF4098 domain-containing protein YvlB